MSFLQPAMLIALPLIALPIVIHLINQYRYRTIEWAAMYFLLTANKMSRGYARIRQWLILLLRTLAIAGLIFAISRPLASGWMRLAAPGTIDTTFILLDRSPSMQQQGTRAGQTKLDSARQQLVQSLKLLKSNRWVLIDSANNIPIEIESPEDLESLLQTEPVSASADIPAMLETVHDYLRDNRPSRSEVWLCSDIRQHDWDPESSRWEVLRNAFLESPFPVHFHLLAYANSASENRSIRLDSARVQETAVGKELSLALTITQSSAREESVPVRLELNGALSEIPVELSGEVTELNNYSLSLEGQPPSGWGRISLPADANTEDNEYFFTYDRPAPRNTIIVSGSPQNIKPLELAAGIIPDSAIESDVKVVSPEQVIDSDLDQVGLLLWQATLPEVETASLVQSLIERGGYVMFFPPDEESETEFAGLSWRSWQEPKDALQGSTWIQDQDLLANVQSGSALPVGELKIFRYRELEGERVTLSTLNSGAPLLVRALTDQFNVYFCTTRPLLGDSTLASEGVVFYVMLQRALAAGAASLGAARQRIAGEIDRDETTDWTPLFQSDRTLSTTFGLQAGAYRSEEHLFAVNRSQAEDRVDVVDNERIAGLFRELPFDRVDETVGSGSALLREIWPTFLVVMMLMLIGEAILCLPRKVVSTSDSSSLAEGMAA